MSEKTSMSVAEVLRRLKTTEAKISKLTSSTTFVDFTVPTQRRDHQEVGKSEANYQAVRDLVAYRRRLRSALIRSNADTLVTIDGVVYSVAEVIDLRSTMPMLKTLRDQLRYQLQNCRSQVDALNKQAQVKLDKLLEIEFGKSQKTNVDNIKLITDSFMASNEAKLLDPLKVTEKVDELSGLIERFEEQVDLTLSESNAKTVVEV